LKFPGRISFVWPEDFTSGTVSLARHKAFALFFSQLVWKQNLIYCTRKQVPPLFH